MKILIISGFLGAGKTTFINQMIKATKREYVIFENEFSDINIDKDILKEENNELNIYEFTNGCICCNMKGDFTSSLIVIQNTLNPDYLIIEPSGVGVLSSIINSIKKVEYEKIKLLNPITILDATSFFTNLNKYKDVVIDQIESAKFIQLSKVEQLDEDELDKIEEEIKKIKKDAIIYKTDYKKQDFDYWDTLFSNELTEEIKNKEIHNLDLENLSYKNTCCDNLIDLMKFLNQIVLGFYGNINRSKGIFKVNDYFLRYDIVDGVYSISFLENCEENSAVFIGRNLKKLQLNIKLNKKLK